MKLDSDSDKWSFTTAEEVWHEDETTKPVRLETITLKFRVDGNMVEHEFADKSVAAITDYILLKYGGQDNLQLSLDGQVLKPTSSIDRYDYHGKVIEVSTTKKIVPEVLPDDAAIPPTQAQVEDASDSWNTDSEAEEYDSDNSIFEPSDSNSDASAMNESYGSETDSEDDDEDDKNYGPKVRKLIMHFKNINRLTIRKALYATGHLWYNDEEDVEL